MSAYVIAVTKSVHDRRRLEEYWARAGVTFEGTGAEPLVIYKPFKLLEGKGPIEGVALVAFPDMDTASLWYESAAYKEVKKYRDGAIDLELILVDGGTVDVEDRMPNTKGNVPKS
jgi:uncharacterized protein (DUF1330 family)